MYISDQHKAVLISNVNTASRSICKFFADNYGFEEKTPKHSYRLEGVRKRFGDEYAEQVKDYTVIMTTRDPFDRAVSIWARLKENKSANDGYGIFWETFSEYAKFMETFNTLPPVSFPGYESPHNSRWVEEHQMWVILPLPQTTVEAWAFEDFGGIDYKLKFADTTTISSIPFVSGEVLLPHIGESGVDSAEYDTEENRRLVALWDKGI
jgi:hypothetical protein